MNTFNSIELLIQQLMSDKKNSNINTSRYPTRFIFLPNVNYLNEFESFVDKLKISKLNLSKFVPNSDGWFTTDTLTTLIESYHKEEDIAVFPFSEVLRFFSDNSFIRVISNLIEIENINPTRRIYIPLVGLFERFDSLILEKFPRIKAKEFSPMWKISEDTNEKIKMYLLDFEINRYNKNKIINNTFEWLNYWKNFENNIIFCYSKTLSTLYVNALPDQVFEITKINNYKEFIFNLLNFYIPITYLKEDDDFWYELYKEIEKINLNNSINNFEDIVLYIFNRKKLELKDVIEIWLECDNNYKKWLLKWFVVKFFGNSYLYDILYPIKNFDNTHFITKIWINIYEHNKINKEWLNERKSYLSLLNKRIYQKIEIEKKLDALFNKLDKNFIFPLLTGFLNVEKKYIIEHYSEFIEHIKEIYPELDYYLSQKGLENNINDNLWIKEYFLEYKKSKVLNSPSDKLKELLFHYNRNKESFYKWFYSFPHYKEIIGNQHVDKIIWVDGLGIEWLSLIIHTLENEGYYVDKSFISRINLPSVTECNKLYTNNLVVIKDLDEYIHKKRNYEFPFDLINEINIIVNIVKNHLITNNKIMLLSDHGFTTFAISDFGNIKKYDFEDSHHEGRAAWIKTKINDDDDFIFIEDQNCKNGITGSIVALRHTSLSNTPRRESHGGATPEEALIPILIICKSSTLNYEISPLTFEISLANPLIKIKIDPTPIIQPSISWYNKTFIFYFNEINKDWTSNLTGIKIGNHDLIVNIGNAKIYIKIKVKGGMTERNLI